MGDAAGPASAIILLGDQPLVDPAVIRQLVEAPLDPARPIVVARHADGSRNPVRVEREAASLVAAAAGDRGLGPLIDSRPELVRTIEVGGANPDVDERRDLVALLEARWADRVRGNAEQVERIREAPDGHDFYATVSRTFVADPARADDPVLERLLALASPADTWLDVGAGAGRYALPLARHVHEVIAVDPSASMLGALRAGMEAHGIPNIRTFEGRWPADAALRTALGAGSDRGCRDDRPRQLRHRADRSVPRRARGRGSPARRGGPDAGQPGIHRRAVLAARPRRGEGRAPGTSGVRRAARGSRHRTRGRRASPANVGAGPIATSS